MRISRTALRLLCCAALCACSAMEDPAASKGTQRSLAQWVTISPAAPTIAPGHSLAFNVQMQDASGRNLTGQPEVFSSSDSSIATVSASGIVTAVALGSAKITVASGSQSAYADVTVSNAPPPPRWVSVSPGTAQVSVRSTLPMFANVTDAAGHLVSDMTVAWTSANPTVAIVDSTGSVTGVTPGRASIIAMAGTNQATAQVTVVAAASPTTPPTGPTPPAPPPPPPVSPPPSSGSLYSGYNAVSPHWQHINTQMTDFYYGWNSAERAWAGQHYDYAMSGSGTAWRAVNPTVGHLPYTLEWTVIIPNPSSQPSLGTVYYTDMVAWYHTHSSYSIENAILHQAGAPRDSAHRAVITIWDSRRWMMNPSDEGARAYQIDRFQRIVATEGGAFVDEAGSDMAGHAGHTQEFASPTAFQAPQTAMFAAIKQAIGNKMLMLNTAEYTADFDRANILAAGAAHLERLNNALTSNTAHNWEWVESLTNQGAFIDFVTIYSSQYVNSIPNVYPRGNFATPAQRMKMWELASYYMVVPSTPQRLALQLENAWSSPYSSLWLRAQEANIGHPMGARVWASRGTDPLGQNYVVYTREMDRALIVMRINQGWGSHSYTDATAVTIPLPATDQWLPLNGDGTLGAPVTSVTLRNVEAAILVKRSRIQ